MSKYADIEQIKEVIRTEWVKYMPMELDMNLSFVLGKISDLPTIEVSEDCINREWVKENMLKYGFLAPDMTVHEFVDDAPSVVPTVRKNRQVERAEGEWVKSGSHCRCSECGYLRFGSSADFCNKYIHFCENCGAKMKG